MADPPLFGTVDRDTRLSDRVAAQMLDTITSRGLQPGDRLPTERELSEQFGVSRTVVREAVRSLVGKGVIDSRAGRGLRVATVNVSAVKESMSLLMGQDAGLDYLKVHEVRTMLEVTVAGYAAERATEPEIARLASLCEQMAVVITDRDAVSVVDVEFHRTLARATQNRLYVVMLEAIADPLMEIRKTTFTLPNRTREALEQHRAIQRAVEARDVEEARRAMAAHLEEVELAWERLARQSSSAAKRRGRARAGGTA